MGQDVANPDECINDNELLQKTKKENRTLITRDKRLAEECRADQVDCILIKASRIEEQLGEMAEFGIPIRLYPRRCTLCNEPLQEIEGCEKPTWQCKSCKKLFWEGSHWIRMKKTLEGIRNSAMSE
jgi:uncharacterized protein